ncbi:MAG: hypothetical protein ACJ8EF_13100 [Bradyrhizobium sp.]|jgi:hypothetical protein
MIEIPSHSKTTRGNARTGRQPIALAAGVLILLVFGLGTIALWRAGTSTASMEERLLALRQTQAIIAQQSEQSAEKTRALALTQQESIDQLQTVHDHGQIMRQLLAGQQSETRRLSGQVSDLATSVEGMRQSLASLRRAEASAPTPRNASPATRPQVAKSANRKPAKSGS